MQRWEYMTWLVGYGGKGPVKEQDGEELPDWKKGPKLAQALNTAGAEGWELIKIYISQYSGNAIDPYYIFRRPLLWDEGWKPSDR